ncbi:hypothetical protein ASG87_16395 [Frateuria sp. Soil773]|uniref:DUF2782 domain-containing protein n=1 Tax=Frateuria sp. Soil773 TaxID=1736407 RepID=UPI0006F1DBCD|nr:DUF2782 domain-containing protein [Frateuria sp. Soil773]KRE96570.1 hypothetical protein ASG87_16395 [Frateuria sp. Soil773]
MKSVAMLVVACALSVPAAFAQTSAPPPPGMHDPGVKASAPAKSAPAEKLNLKAPPQAGAPVPRDARGEAPPEVKVRQEGDNTVQEFSRNGQVYMVVITPKAGVPQTYMVDPQGRLVDEHGQKPPGTVMYKVLEWGKSRPAEADDGGR